MRLANCPITLKSGSATVNQRRFVNYAAGGVVQASDGGFIVGINHTALPTSGSDRKALAVTTNPGSIDEVEASAAIADGAEVASAANGLAKTATSGDFIFGVAVDATTASGQSVSVLISPRGIKA